MARSHVTSLPAAASPFSSVFMAPAGITGSEMPRESTDAQFSKS